jgi:hypothetical protein
VTASSSLPGSPAVAAVDGIPATAWVAREAHAEFTIQLSNSAKLSSVAVVRGTPKPLHYSVELSTDRTHWTSVAEASGLLSGTTEATQELRFAPRAARYVRLVFPGIGDAQPPNITEIVVKAKGN